ncbi:DUF998 domain-containing protein [Halogranum rubrum]|uniref:DUF998 domain-containing protein n=1 Tax=Halogranum salarium B-1 TaxID=1210908 RepID=J3JDY4_9EURY|nr:DUF998 domain-containing protein [Halogranum salarium]EJN57891.1 hypothetical protein HSB1_33080 [Halogranum salarium B-1]
MTTIESHDRQTATFYGVAYDNERLAGGLFALLAAQFMTVIMLASAMAPGYDFNGAAISDLGVIDETALLFNASLVAAGLLNVVGGYLFYRTHGKRWLLGLFVLAGVGAAGAGLFPLDTGGVHSLFALVAFVCFNLQAFASLTAVEGVMKLLSALAGVVGLAFLVVMAIGDGGNAAVFGPIGHNGTERMIVYPVMFWLLILGGYLMGQSGRPTRSDAPTSLRR